MALWRKLTMFGRMRLLVAAPIAALAFAGGGTPAGAMQLSEGLAQLYSSVSINPPSADRVTICYGFVCRRRYVFDVDRADENAARVSVQNFARPRQSRVLRGDFARGQQAVHILSRDGFGESRLHRLVDQLRDILGTKEKRRRVFDRVLNGHSDVDQVLIAGQVLGRIFRSRPAQRLIRHFNANSQAFGFQHFQFINAFDRPWQAVMNAWSDALRYDLAEANDNRLLIRRDEVDSRERVSSQGHRP